ncbi:MAG: bifunctional riboflavin kinase/FAD synthetase [Acidobacteria bacterium]|nr:bifunctional riboflavin kinase/FAD synthetase [Acidobacteriota bacterium]
MLEGLDVLFLDALRHTPHPTHSTVERSLRYVEQLRPRRAFFTPLEEIPAGFGPSALTVGNFDGVHLGHARIFHEVMEIARANGWRAMALTFHPHPAQVVAPDRVPRLLTTLGARLSLIEQRGLDGALVLPFTAEVARLEPEEFVRAILVEKLGVRAAVVGANFRFGHDQTGDVKTLESLGHQYRFSVGVVGPVCRRGQLVSSSVIRRLVAEGRVSRARQLLGRPFGVEGRVVPGHGVGARQTVPTLNLAPDTEVLPARGVYLTCTLDPASGCRWPSLTNIGYRPTFGGAELSVETFLLRPLEGLSPARLEVTFWRRVRDEMKFPTPEALRAQIFRDVATAEKFFRRLRAEQILHPEIPTTKERIS